MLPKIGDLVAFDFDRVYYGIIADEDYKALYVKFHDDPRLIRYFKEYMKTPDISWEVISAAS